MMKPARSLLTEVLRSLETGIAIMALSMIVLSLALWWGGATAVVSNLPLWGALALGGGPLVWQLLTKLVRREFGSDLLAGISIVVSIILGEYLAGTLVVLMLSGGAALEAYAVRSASSVVQALARRMPTTAHRKVGLNIEDIPLEQIQIGDSLVVFPHEAAPVDGIVLEGHGVMDESYLTGEPFMMSKTPGSAILSGAVNGETALVIQTEALPIDSRYAKIMRVIQSAEGERPRMRRLGDQLGAWYTPLALAIAALAWIVSGEAVRFLAVLVVATPCPLLIAIPVTVIGSISLAAKRAIIVRDPAALEAADTCRTIIFDKTGTLTYGKPQLIEVVPAAGIDPHELLVLVSNLERYSKHPLADAIVTAGREARGAVLEVKEISERPGAGMQGLVAGRKMEITSRKKLLASSPDNAAVLPEQVGGLECLVLINGRYAGAFRFRDAPRGEGAPYVKHLG
ncbi:MAG TPA: HAD-IC family P-type ATPase, partial [Pirellulaceae bacterium]|nr:HAD-IC family P-type ATPase [Pirellulaceae bacterium]